MRRRLAPLPGLVVLLALAPATAAADAENDLGLTPRTAALGGAVVATGGDFAASAYSPAALIVPGDRDGLGELHAGLIIAAPAVWAESATPGASLDLPAPENTYSLVVGGRWDVGRGLGAPGLVLGLGLYTPLEGLLQSRIRPDESPSWLHLTDRTQHLAVHVALAYRIVPWLSVGVGVRITLDEEAFITGTATEVTRVTDPMTGEERVEAGAALGLDAAVYGRAGPTAGVLVAPLPELRFAFAWRSRLFSDDWGWARLQGIDGVGDLGFAYRFAHVYRPHELVWGAAVRAHEALEISAELMWQLWDDPRSPAGQLLPGRFGDVLVPSIGVRVAPTPGVDLLAGYRYARSPFDNLGGPTNLLSNDVHHVSLGAEVDLDVLVTGEDVPFTLSVSGRLSILEAREEVKNGRHFPSDRALLTNPGYPGYRYGGMVPSVQLGVETRW